MKKPLLIQITTTIAAYLLFCFIYWDINCFNWTWYKTDIGDFKLSSNMIGRLMLLLQLAFIFGIGAMVSAGYWFDYNKSKKK